MDIIPRHLAEILTRTLRITRVLNIVGPRQAGKTTLVRDMVEAARYLDLDDETSLLPWRSIPMASSTLCRQRPGQPGCQSSSTKSSAYHKLRSP